MTSCFPPTVNDVTPSVETSAINNSHTHVATGDAFVDVSKLAQSIENSSVPLDSSRQISDISPDKTGNLMVMTMTNVIRGTNLRQTRLRGNILQ
jgi:hypothetical protein